MPVTRQRPIGVMLAAAALASALLGGAAPASASGGGLHVAAPAPALGYAAALQGEAALLQGEAAPEAGPPPREAREQARRGAREARALQREARARERRAGRCVLSINASAQTVTAGETANVFGKLACPEGTSAGERTVTVFCSGYGQGRSVVGMTTTEADGSYQLNVPALAANAVLSVRAARAQAARVAIKVAPRLTLAFPPAGAELAAAGGFAQRASRARATFSGTVEPAAPGALVALQSAYAAAGGRWRPVAVGRADERGSFTIAHSFRTPGMTWVRVVVHPGHHKVAVASEAVPYQVVAAQNPQLTIQSSSPIVSFGESVAISGVAAGAAGARMGLLARSAHGSFEEVASTTSDSAGRYTFTRVPASSSYYRVRDTATVSTTLFQHVSCGLMPDATPSSASAGQAVAFAGKLLPADSGQAVALERQSVGGVGFHPLAGAPVQGGSYSIAYAFKQSGDYVLRIKVSGDAGHESAASAAFTLRVTPSPAGALTSLGPAPSLAEGPGGSS